jgi:hypothetical protein
MLSAVGPDQFLWSDGLSLNSAMKFYTGRGYTGAVTPESLPSSHQWPSTVPRRADANHFVFLEERALHSASHGGPPLLKVRVFLTHGLLVTSRCHVHVLLRRVETLSALVSLFPSHKSEFYKWTKWPVSLKIIPSLRSARWSRFYKKKEWVRTRFMTDWWMFKARKFSAQRMCLCGAANLKLTGHSMMIRRHAEAEEEWWILPKIVELSTAREATSCAATR